MDCRGLRKGEVEDKVGEHCRDGWGFGMKLMVWKRIGIVQDAGKV